MKKNVILEAKPIGDIKGVFNIPAYQRGYRWGKLQVKTLLNDLYQKANDSTKKDYCLQPIVVLRKGEGEYDLIDGQQRLTTIYSSELYQTVLPVCATELQPHIRNENEHTDFSQQYG